jgi:hypothetical protein
MDPPGSGREGRSWSGRHRGWLVLIFLAVVGLQVAVVVHFWLSLRSLSALADTDDAPSRHDVEVYGGVELPPDVRDLRARVRIVLTKRQLLARFSITPDELPALLASGGFRELRAGPFPRSVPDPPDWWTPEVARSSRMVESGRGAILVVVDRPDRYLVYLARDS